MQLPGVGVNYCRASVKKDCNIVDNCEECGANIGIGVNEVWIPELGICRRFNKLKKFKKIMICAICLCDYSVSILKLYVVIVILCDYQWLFGEIFCTTGFR